MAIDHLFPAKVIQAATVAIQGGRSRVQMVQRRYHLRSFENVLVDSHESRVYSPEHARVVKLFAYHLDLSVTLDAIDCLDRLRGFLQNGFKDSAEYIKFRSMAKGCVDGTIILFFSLLSETLQNYGSTPNNSAEPGIPFLFSWTLNQTKFTKTFFDGKAFSTAHPHVSHRPLCHRKLLSSHVPNQVLAAVQRGDRPDRLPFFYENYFVSSTCYFFLVTHQAAAGVVKAIAACNAKVRVWGFSWFFFDEILHTFAQFCIEPPILKNITDK